MTKKATTLVLSFTRKLTPSAGIFYGTCWENRSDEKPLRLIEKSVRGTISNRFKSKKIKEFSEDSTKLDAEVEKPNLQKVDACALSMEHDTLKLRFTLKILGGICTPSACNNEVFKQSYFQATQDYIAREGFQELAKRYAINIASGRFLWRNRVGAEQIEVHVTNAANKEQTWQFDAKAFKLNDFDVKSDSLDTLAASIAEVLSSDDDFLQLDITCFAQVGYGQEVYPSQELVFDKGKADKSKVLYEVNQIAAMHSQKLGNALRSIDTWYPEFHDDTHSAGAIAIEPYGAVTNLGKAFRNPKDKQDFFSFFDKFACGEKLERIEDEHYVMAVLVRGGVFGETEKSDK